MTNWTEVQKVFDSGLGEVFENKAHWNKVAEDLGYRLDVVVARKLSRDATKSGNVVIAAKSGNVVLDEHDIAFAIESRLCDFGWFPTTYETRARMKGQSLSAFLASVLVEGLIEFTKMGDPSDEEKYLEQIRRQQCPGCGDTDII
jgi:DNA-binding LacI/PurR family transcriptional regulator